MKIAMIPARMGSQRLKQKNLRELHGIPLIVRAIRKCQACGLFDEIWVNSENDAFRSIAETEHVHFHKRPKELGNNIATSEQYIAEFLQKHTCEHLFQIHSIAPLLSVESIIDFVEYAMRTQPDTLLAVENTQIECLYEGKPINFSFNEKTNSQDLRSIQRISWAITCWRRSSYLQAISQGQCATYSGKIDTFALSHLASHVIKTELDLQFAEALLPLIEQPVS